MITSTRACAPNWSGADEGLGLSPRQPNYAEHAIGNWVRMNLVGGSASGYRRFISLERSRLRPSRFRLERSPCRRMTSRRPILRPSTSPYRSAPRAWFGSLPDISGAAVGGLRTAQHAIAQLYPRRPAATAMWCFATEPKPGEQSVIGKSFVPALGALQSQPCSGAPQ